MSPADAFAARVLALVDGGQLAASPPHRCPYLPERVASERGFRAEHLPGELYHDLMDRGFRRSGDVFYAPACPTCRACVPLRVPVATFVPSRSQRRTLRRNRDVEVTVDRPRFDTGKWDLYRRYLAHQHPRAADDPAPPPNVDDFRASLYAEVVDTYEVCYHLAGRLIAASVLDVCSRSVSAVYHYYDPEHAPRRLGVFSALAEIDWARRHGIPHYYLGYWIADADTMRYKADYRPHEVLREGRWSQP